MCARDNLFKIVKTNKQKIIYVYSQSVHLCMNPTQDSNHAPTQEARVEY